MSATAVTQAAACQIDRENCLIPSDKLKRMIGFVEINRTVMQGAEIHQGRR
jgi:hypothetical protein